MKTGHIKWFNLVKNFGFITSNATNTDIFFSGSELDINLRNKERLNGFLVEFGISQDLQGRNIAINVRPLNKDSTAV
jgi:cold shock CspA family protein